MEKREQVSDEKVGEAIRLWSRGIRWEMIAEVMDVEGDHPEDKNFKGGER